MSMTRWDPFDDLMSLREAMNQLIESSYIRPRSGTMTGSQQGGRSLPLDVYETDNDVVVKASLPGVKPDDININLHGNILTITGEIKSEQSQPSSQSQEQRRDQSQEQRRDQSQTQGQSSQSQNPQGNVSYHRQERFFGRYFRQVMLPEDVQGEKAEANYEHGVLTVTFPKSEQAKPRQIKISSGSASNQLGSGSENIRIEGSATPVNENQGKSQQHQQTHQSSQQSSSKS